MVQTRKRHCDARCMLAKSEDCSCECNGENHGRQRNFFEEIGVQDRPKGKTEEYGMFMAKKVRKHSRELDFGVWWRDGKNHPTYRVSWIDDTGELYAVPNVGWASEDSQPAEVLGIFDTEKQVETALEGWAKACGKINSLNWIRARC